MVFLAFTKDLLTVPGNELTVVDEKNLAGQFGNFLNHLQVSGAFPKPPNGLRVAQTVERMVSAGLLVRAGYAVRRSA